MEAFKILRKLYSTNKPRWKKAFPKHDAFRIVLDMSVSDAAISRTLRDDNIPAPTIVERLAEAEIQKKITNKLDLPCELFEVSSEESLVCLLIEHGWIKDPVLPNSEIGLRVYNRESVESLETLHLSRNEETVLQKLETAVTTGSRISNAEHPSTIKSPFLYWPTSLESGSSLFAHLLARRLILSKSFESVFILNPKSAGLPFQAELTRLADMLGISAVNRSGRQIASALLQQNILLILNNADLIGNPETSRHSYVKELIQWIKSRQAVKGEPAYLLLVGEPSPQVFDFRGTNTNLESIEEATIHPKRQRFNFFREQFERFKNFRQYSDVFVGSDRLKRARWYYELVSDKPVHSMNIRVRAFFASNRDNLFYFDPTAGFEALSGMPYESLPLDIQCYVDDIRMYIKSLPNKGPTKGALSLLRSISTAKYWLTETARIALEEEVDSLKLSKAKRNNLEALLKRLHKSILVSDREDLSSYTQVDGKSVPKTYSIYTAGIGIKSLIQDHWRVENSYERKMAHFAIAQRLHVNMNDDATIKKEFPYEALWGNPRIIPVVECIRHLVRACEDVEEPDKIEGYTGGLTSRFPTAPDPIAVWSFCYNQLFKSELDGYRRIAKKHLSTRQGAIHLKQLTYRHGAFHLKLEVLQLLSNGGKLGNPHWALHKDEHINYLRELAFSHLDLGHLDEAKISFSKLVGLANNIKDEYEALNQKINLVLVETIRGNFCRAKNALEAIESELQTATLTDGGHERIKHRLITRRIHLLYLSERYQSALQLFDKISSTPLKRDVAHYYIATISNIANRQVISDSHKKALYDKAMSVCLSNLFENTSNQLHHEAIGFRISLAHLLRHQDQLEAAESCLDRVYIDIIKYGCSERTYIALLLEAGRLLARKGKYVRAYAAYLGPCMDRAYHLGFKREALSAKKEALSVLEKIKVKCGECSADVWNKEYLTEIKPSENLKALATPSKVGDIPLDPLYSYDFISIEDGRFLLTNSKKIDEQIENCENMCIEIGNT